MEPRVATTDTTPKWHHFAIKGRGAGPQSSGASTSTLELAVGDITEDDSGAIVNPTNGRLDAGGMVDLAVRRAAGPALTEACWEALRARGTRVLAPGEAVITPGFRLKAGYVIHCAPPMYADDPIAAPARLATCCRAAIGLARRQGLSSIAFPSIGTGVLGYPLHEAAPIIVSTLVGELAQEALGVRVRILLYGPSMLEAYVTAARACLDRPSGLPRVARG